MAFGGTSNQGLSDYLRRMYIPATALLVFSYPLTTVWVLEFGIEASLFNFSMKFFIAVLFLLSIGGSLFFKSVIPLDFYPLFIFYGLYGIRLVYDVLVRGLVMSSTSSFQVLSYFFLLTFLPGVAIAFSFRTNEVRRLVNWCMFILIFSNLSLLYFVFNSGVVESNASLTGRLEVVGDEVGTAVLNPIVVSITGAMMGLTSLAKLCIDRHVSIGNQFFWLIMGGIGLVNLLAGGSRGPLIDFVLGVFCIGVSAVLNLFGVGRLKISSRVLLYGIIFILVMVYLAVSNTFELTVFERFEDMFSQGLSGRAVEERDYIFAAAWQEFSSSPVIGSGYLVMNNSIFPHNSFLEALTSVGFFGGLAYIFCFVVFLRGVASSLLGYVDSAAVPLALWAVCLMALSMTSGSVGQTPETWCLMTLMMCMSSIGIGRRIANRNLGDADFGALPTRN